MRSLDDIDAQPLFDAIYVPFYFFHRPRIVAERMDDCLKKSAESRMFGVSISSLPYSGDLANELLGFSSKLESVFTKMQKLRADGVTRESEYKSISRFWMKNLLGTHKLRPGYMFVVGFK